MRNIRGPFGVLRHVELESDCAWFRAVRFDEIHIYRYRLFVAVQLEVWDVE